MITDTLLFITLGWFALVGLKHTPIAYIGYLWTELLAPQRIAVGFLSTMPMSMIMAVVCLASIMLNKENSGRSTHTGLVVMMTLFAAWFWLTTQWATNPVPAGLKFDWAWRSIVFTMIALFIFRTRLALELLLISIVACVGYFALVTGLKTIVSGGGYGRRLIFGGVNFGLSESSTLGAMTVACIPLIVFLTRHGTLLPRTRLIRWASTAIIVIFIAAVIGTHSRTGLVCLGVLACSALVMTQHKTRIFFLFTAVGFVLFTFAGRDWLERMSTMSNVEKEGSASGRLDVWRWTIDYTKSHPFGAGFDAFLDNAGQLDPYLKPGSLSHGDNALAYHSVYFEILGEQGYVGLAIFFAIIWTTIALLYRARRDARKIGDYWIQNAAAACFISYGILLVGSAFVGIAYRPYLYLFSVAGATLATLVKNNDVTTENAPL